MSRKKRFKDLPASVRAILLPAALCDAGLKAWALADLVNRPQSQVKGPKAAWAVALTLVNSVGILPAVYLLGAREH